MKSTYVPTEQTLLSTDTLLYCLIKLHLTYRERDHDVTTDYHEKNTVCIMYTITSTYIILHLTEAYVGPNNYS